MVRFSTLLGAMYHKLGFRRLFWRVFIWFWLSSLLVMFATSFVIISKYSSEDYAKRYSNDVLTQAERIVWRYEQTLVPQANRSVKLKNWINKKENRRGHLMSMLIMDDTKQRIYHYRLNKVKPEDRLAHSVFGPSGRSYQVFSKKPQAPRIYTQLMYRFQSLQFVFIFFASALVSALLSWSITRPLNYLGSFSRHYANKQEVAPLPRALLTRGDEVADLAQDIEFMINKTHAAATAQQQLLHDVSHELRAPLARLQVSAALIEQKSPDSRHVKQIHNDCLRIDQLIQQILDYSKLEQGNPAQEPCNINALCEQVIKNMAVTYPDIPVTFKADNKSQLNGYPEALLQAFDNIIGNACKYSSDGQPVDISVNNRENSIVVSVRDHGPGVDESEMSKLLQPFYRAGNKMHTNGFGLGLSIALKAINKHHGELRISTPDGGGLLVEIILPRDTVA